MRVRVTHVVRRACRPVGVSYAPATALVTSVRAGPPGELDECLVRSPTRLVDLPWRQFGRGCVPPGHTIVVDLDHVELTPDEATYIKLMLRDEGEYLFFAGTPEVIE